MKRCFLYLYNFFSKGLWGSVLMGSLLVLLSGCPNHFEQFEQYYFQDRFIDAVILIQQDDVSIEFLQQLTKFLKRNQKRLSKNLLLEIQQFDESISDEDVNRLKQLLISLDKWKITFSEYSLEYDTLITAINKVIEKYIAKKQFDITFLLHHHRYRQARSSLEVLQNQKPLLPTQNKLLKQLQSYIVRQLFVDQIRVHDNHIDDFKDESPQDHYSNYLKKGETLFQLSTDVPVEFFRHFEHYFNKEKSDVLFLNQDTNQMMLSHYRLVCSVGVNVEKQLIEERKEIEDTFLVQFNLHADWEEYPVFYELFTTKTIYSASVNAAVYLANDVVGHYIFEVFYPVETVRVGEFLYLSEDILEMAYSQQYKGYRKGNIIREESYYLQEVLDDAANVLVVKLLNTIDRDPDPYSLKNPLQID
tara:strand:+ start:2003 stop:3253 length:1251 start_codon:yes stop_codon:yes gene_type:complete